MYPYHNRLKQLLNQYKDSYIVIREKHPYSYRFIFPEINESRPIREYRNDEYDKWINRK